MIMPFVLVQNLVICGKCNILAPSTNGYCSRTRSLSSVIPVLPSYKMKVFS
jgi:hypothetical protein